MVIWNSFGSASCAVGRAYSNHKGCGTHKSGRTKQFHQNSGNRITTVQRRDLVQANAVILPTISVSHTAMVTTNPLDGVWF